MSPSPHLHPALAHDRWATLRRGLIAAALGAAAAASQAALVNYNEASDGDLSEHPAPMTVLDLGVGINTVDGTFGFNDQGIDFDNFAFRVPDGAQLVGITMALADSAGINFSSWQLRTGTTLLSGTVLDLLESPTPGSDSFDGPLVAGSYHLFHTGFAGASLDGGFADYHFALIVQANDGTVPEPASALLLAAAAGGLFGARRRARSAASAG